MKKKWRWIDVKFSPQLQESLNKEVLRISINHALLSILSRLVDLSSKIRLAHNHVNSRSWFSFSSSK